MNKEKINQNSMFLMPVYGYGISRFNPENSVINKIRKAKNNEIKPNKNNTSINELLEHTKRYFRKYGISASAGSIGTIANLLNNDILELMDMGGIIRIFRCSHSAKQKAVALDVYNERNSKSRKGNGSSISPLQHKK